MKFEKEEKQYLAVLFGLLLLCIIGSIWSGMSVFKDIERAEKNLGKKVILGKDTVIVIDYSMWNNSFILSNGKEVGFEFGKKYAK